MEEKFCKDCRYCKKTKWFTYESSMCEHPNFAPTYSFNPVTGKKQETPGKSFLYCVYMRNSSGECGKEGKLFNPKDKFLHVLHCLDKKA